MSNSTYNINDYKDFKNLMSMRMNDNMTNFGMNDFMNMMTMNINNMNIGTNNPMNMMNIGMNNTIVPNTKEEKEKMNKNGIVIGIDFGTSGIACAYGFLDNENNPTGVYFDGQADKNKIPSEIILDDDLKVKAFGNKCTQYYNSLNEKKYHHFYKIKMNLYDRIYKIKARNSDKEVDIQCIIKLMLIEIKKKAIEQIKITIPSLDENKIHWVITVPAIWELKSKQIMINAAQEAGMIREDDDISNFFALEPEAASIYYQNSPQADQEIKDSVAPFIVCDFGGGTVDIVTQIKTRTNSGLQFEENFPPIGGCDGCNKINEYFMERIIKELFGEKCFNEAKINICKNRYNEWIKFEKKIEEFKKKFISQEEQINGKQSINCYIFQEYYKKDINVLIENFNKKHKNYELKIDKNWKIYFPFKIIYDLMDELTDKISKYIFAIIEEVPIETIIFSGGASVNPILRQLIKDKVSRQLSQDKFMYKKNLKFVQSHNPEVAISYGSVLFSYDHNIISPRKAKYSFGIKMRDDWNEEMHHNGGIKIYDELDKKDKCENLFSKFIDKNENITSEEEIVKSYKMCFSKVTVELYKTEYKNITFCDEKDEKGNLKIFKFGEFIIDVGDSFDISNRDAEVKMKIGGTFISAEAKYLKTEKSVKISCLFE